MFSREFQKFALAVAAVGVISVSATAAVADDYPNKPIHLLIGSAPGGGTDTLGRVLAKTLETQKHCPILFWFSQSPFIEV